MGASTKALLPSHQEFIANQHVFFVATAPKDGFINLSPKGINSLHVLSPTRVLWLNLTGSGNETAAHLLEDSRMTIMMNAFEGSPMILRLYGQAHCVHPRDADWVELYSKFEELPGARQIVVLDIEKVMTSCGFGVPILKYERPRTELVDWAKKKGPDGIKEYQTKKNLVSLNGKDTGLFD